MNYNINFGRKKQLCGILKADWIWVSLKVVSIIKLRSMKLVELVLDYNLLHLKPLIQRNKKIYPWTYICYIYGSYAKSNWFLIIYFYLTKDNICFHFQTFLWHSKFLLAFHLQCLFIFEMLYSTKCISKEVKKFIIIRTFRTLCTCHIKIHEIVKKKNLTPQVRNL